MFEFRTPVVALPFAHSTDRLWGRVTFDRGYAVVKRTDGTYAQVELVDRDLPGVEHVYVGGHVHLVDEAEAQALTNAGYGAYLTEVA